ncbi:hypothetical protein NIIDMKKI_52190 [Mycobacterium kansasii]|uniref:MMPL family protein n=1 Tax=Mycobacterium kansasii TaxID=1768 RepID=A0A7G1IIZ2_MYCKA|nr:hypothetical protein NIIDMKKI_52190 [Mycobacterium kansasii]
MLVVLPPLLALSGRRLFWPFIPEPDAGATLESGLWHSVAERVARRPALVAAATIAILALLATGLLGTRTGLSQTEQFRVKADSVTGFDIVDRHFPAGLASPTIVVAPAARVRQVQQAISATPGVVSATESGRSTTGLAKWSVVIDAPPASKKAFGIVAALRNSTVAASPARWWAAPMPKPSTSATRRHTTGGC